MAYDAMVAADAVVDYTQFDNTGDGGVESIAILHVGEGQGLMILWIFGRTI